METVGVVLLLLAWPILVIVLVRWHLRRSRRIVQAWAAANGYRLLSAERRWLWFGPFWWRTGRGHAVFRVTVSDSAGNCRGGFVRVGGWLLGMFSNRAVAVWDD